MTTLLHTADWHLGKRQYGLGQRGLDIARAARWVCALAKEQGVPVLIAGDIFDSRDSSPVAFRQAMACLGEFQQQLYPLRAVAIPGNHDRGWRMRTSWLSVLRDIGALELLDIETTDAGVNWDGAVSMVNDVRVVGVPYLGTGIVPTLQSLLAYLKENPYRPTVLMLHSDLDNIVPGFASRLHRDDLKPFVGHVDYVAMGHLHKPFLEKVDGVLIGNPGTMEALSAHEADWQGGPIMVHFGNGTVSAKPVSYPNRRPYLRMTVDVAGARTMDELIGRISVDGDFENALVDITLNGVLGIPSRHLNLKAVREMVASMGALYCTVKDRTTDADRVAVEGSDGKSRAALEREILTANLANDPRFAGAAERWAYTARELEALVASRTHQERALDLVAETTREIDGRQRR